MNVGKKGMFCVAPQGKIRIKGWEFQSEKLRKVAEESKHQIEVSLSRTLDGKGPGESKIQDPWVQFPPGFHKLL